MAISRNHKITSYFICHFWMPAIAGNFCAWAGIDLFYVVAQPPIPPSCSFARILQLSAGRQSLLLILLSRLANRTMRPACRLLKVICRACLWVGVHQSGKSLSPISNLPRSLIPFPFSDLSAAMTARATCSAYLDRQLAVHGHGGCAEIASPNSSSRQLWRWLRERRKWTIARLCCLLCPDLFDSPDSCQLNLTRRMPYPVVRQTQRQQV